MKKIHPDEYKKHFRNALSNYMPVLSKIDDLDDAPLVYAKLEEWLSIEITGMPKTIVANERLFRTSARVHNFTID